MAVKSLLMMNLVCQRKYLDDVLMDLVLSENCAFIDTFIEIDAGEFTIGITEEHAEEILGMESIVPHESNKEIKAYITKMEELIVKLGLYSDSDWPQIGEREEFESLKGKVDELYGQLVGLMEGIQSAEEYRAKLNEYAYFKQLTEIDIDFHELSQLKHFTMKIGCLKRDMAKKISLNYENIQAIVMHVGAYQDSELYIVVSPKRLDLEMERILKSVNFQELPLPVEYLNKPVTTVQNLETAMRETEMHLEVLKEESGKLVGERREFIGELCSKLEWEQVLDQIRVKVAVTKNFAYLSAWIPAGERSTFEDLLSKYKDIVLSFKSADEVSPRIPIPTRIKNHPFFQPFEMLVNMYGVPSYNELDPTVFFGVAYMILFGAMFGDLGQGALIMLLGVVLKHRISADFSAILTRIGLGSMAFGILYDSFFGYEHVISAILPLSFYLRPIDNINLVLILAVCIGIVLIYFSFTYSVLNKLKIGDYEEAFFGKNGINGIILFTLILLLVYGYASGWTLYSARIPAAVIGVSVTVLLAKRPIANKFFGMQTEYEEDAKTYYIEGGFNVFEVFLTLLSNCISFVRVGAFALNHVGLFIAFHTLASMIGGVGGNLVMFVVGNVIIIGLEGLIVFIQGLRLFYYELFSKYYSGEGVLFLPEKFRGCLK